MPASRSSIIFYGASRVCAALRVLQQLFPDTLVALGTARQIEVSQLSEDMPARGVRMVRTTPKPKPLS